MSIISLCVSNTDILSVFIHFYQSVLEKEKKKLFKEHTSNELKLLKEKCDIDNHAVSLYSRLDAINSSLDCLRAKQSYNISTAVNEAKRDERSH